MKISKFDNVETRTVSKNRVIEDSSITKNEKFEQIGDEVIQKHIKSFSFSNVSNNTNRKNLLRICRIVNSVDYKVQNFIHLTRSFQVSFLTLNEIFETYKQLPHAQFLKIFVQIILSEIIEKVN